MDQKIFDFLSSHKVCSLTTLLNNGSPHASALHYSYEKDPLELYFSTENTSLKTQALLEKKPTKASVVIGFSEEEWITLQMDGEVRAVLDSEELKTAHTVHYAKVTESLFIITKDDWFILGLRKNISEYMRSPLRF